MTEKPLQESFLAQLSEVDVGPVQPQSIEVLQIDPIFEAKVDTVSFDQSSNIIKPDHPEESYQKECTNTSQLVITSSSLAVSSNGNAASILPQQDIPKPPLPQTVTGNVKIQLMEISVDEFKANVDYIQQRYPSLPRRLICDTFSKANFDCRLALELLAKEQEKKDPTIVPPLVAAAAKQLQQQQQKQQQQQPQTPKSAAHPPPAPPPTPLTPDATAAPAATEGEEAAQTPQRPQRQLPLPRSGPRRSRVASGGAKEDPCYRRVVVVDKEAEMILRQKLKSNVRSRVFNHGVKIAQGRETAANLVHHELHQPLLSEAPGDGEPPDEEASRASMAPDVAEASSAATDPAVAAELSLAAASPDPTKVVGLAVPGPDTLDVAPQSPMRILRESFPAMEVSRIAETLESCGQDVDAAIRLLSGRPLVAASPSGASEAKKFFKSRGQLASAKKEYVKAELSTGAWMDHRTAGKIAAAAGAKAGGTMAAATAGPPAVTSLRVFTVQSKKRIKAEIPDAH